MIKAKFNDLALGARFKYILDPDYPTKLLPVSVLEATWVKIGYNKIAKWQNDGLNSAGQLCCFFAEDNANANADVLNLDALPQALDINVVLKCLTEN